MAKKRITVLSLSTPTFNNVRAASALPYHLMLGTKSIEDVDFEVYSFNINEINGKEINQIEQDLRVKIHLMEKPRWIKWLMALHLTFLRIFLKYPIYCYCKLSREAEKEIQDSKPDIIWVYGEELVGLAGKFCERKSIITMPDCESLYYYRMLRLRWATQSLFHIAKSSFAYWQYKKMERDFCQSHILYHFVGKDDAEFFKAMNPMANTIFLPHPLYAYNENKEIKFHQPKIKLLFAGRYDSYCQHGSDELLSEMEEQAEILSSDYEITFLGKDWEKWNDRLRKAGYTSSHIVFASDYVGELQKHDIQVNAIDVGTGTKGKVLDAIANGLLVIGTSYALENIAVKNNESCVVVADGRAFVDVLQKIKKNLSLYEKMAWNGRSEVIRVHNNHKIAESLFLQQ